ncbi:eIF-2-alpha kinase activator gcn1 [Bienertia sinuspersici]
MISVEESELLFSLMNSEQRTFEEVMADLNSKFPSYLHFRICTALSTLLELWTRGVPVNFLALMFALVQAERAISEP